MFTLLSRKSFAVYLIIPLLIDQTLVLTKGSDKMIEAVTGENHSSGLV